MREIKFRGWDKIEHEMLFDGIEYELRLISHIYEAKTTDEALIGFTKLDFDRFELMQFTGLKDENEIDIYEDDIIQDFVGRIWIVKYNEKMASFTFHYQKDQNRYQSFQLFSEFQLPFKIIGNIYENPELL
jgi:uncharacterized phage protein (TIGR01671 family)